jgi:hypothetical protein
MASLVSSWDNPDTPYSEVWLGLGVIHLGLATDFVHVKSTVLGHVAATAMQHADKCQLHACMDM